MQFIENGQKYSDKNRIELSNEEAGKNVSDELSEWEMERKSNLKDELKILIALIWNSLHLLYFMCLYVDITWLSISFGVNFMLLMMMTTVVVATVLIIIMIIFISYSSFPIFGTI